MDNRIPHNKVRFSFITDNPSSVHLNVRKHGSEWISIDKYNKIMELIYG